MNKKLLAAVFVYGIRHHLPQTESGIMDCPVCGELLQWYDANGWLHRADGDADCWGAIGYGKGDPPNGE